MKTGIELIADERQRQIEVEGYTKEHDSKHDPMEFVDAAIAYAKVADIDHRIETDGLHPGVIDQRLYSIKRFTWPWDENGLKPTTCVRDLIKAGALIAAAIDRLNSN